MKSNNQAFTSKQSILQESKQQKLQLARQLKQQSKFYESIQAYHKVIFLSEKPEYLVELGEIYEKELMDVSSAVLFYRRALVLKPKNTIQLKQKLKQLTKIKGLQLLEMGSCKNILQGSYLQEQKSATDFALLEEFKKTYPTFHHRLITNYIDSSTTSYTKVPFKDHLHMTLAFLEVNHREFALEQIQNCLLIDQKNVDLIVLKALLLWAMLEKEKGYKEFWNGYKLEKQHEEVTLFIRLITPQVQELYQQAKYNLIENNVDKCGLKVTKGLQMHPYHTDLLILKAFLHRAKSQYKPALQCLQLANSHLPESLHSKKFPELQHQISLTYNQMAIYLFKQQKYQEAIQLFTQGMKFNDKDHGLYTNRGDCHKAMNQFVMALEDYLKAYQIEKKSTELNLRIATIYSMRGVSLFNSRNYQLALRQFQQCLKYVAKNEQFIASKAKCLIQLARKQQALTLLSQTLAQNPTFTEIKSLLQQVKQPEQKRGPNNRKIIQLSKEKS